MDDWLFADDPTDYDWVFELSDITEGKIIDMPSAGYAVNPTKNMVTLKLNATSTPAPTVVTTSSVNCNWDANAWIQWK